MNQGVEQEIKELISEDLSIDISKVTKEAHLADDLGADSLDLVELIMVFEERFDVEIQDEVAEKISTVGQLLDYADKMGWRL